MLNITTNTYCILYNQRNSRLYPPPILGSFNCKDKNALKQTTHQSLSNFNCFYNAEKNFSADK